MGLVFMLRRFFIFAVLLAQMVPVCLAADENDVPLGDIARALRQEKGKDKNEPERRVIDNENLDQLMNELQRKRFSSTSLMFSIDGEDKGFKVSAPDVSCNLSFNAKTTSLLTDPFMPRSVPGAELAKLDGPAVIQDNTLQVSVFNGSGWNIKELVVGVTMVRTTAPRTYGPYMVKPAAETVVETSEKRPDQTVIYHLRGNAVPQSTTVFTAELTSEPAPDQEWHWAIVGAKGIPVELPVITTPVPEMSTPVMTPAAPTAGPVPATSTGNPHP
jgi:hypothetical protein